MPNSYASQNVICPFYMYEKEKAMYCEGLIKGSRHTITNFKNKDTFKKYKIMFCNSEYKKCELCKALLRKYD